MASDEMREKEADLGLGDSGPSLGPLLAFCEALGKWLHLLAPQFPQRRLAIAATTMLLSYQGSQMDSVCYAISELFPVVQWTQSNKFGLFPC